MKQGNALPHVDIEILKAQVDAEIAARLQAEAEYEQHIHRRGFISGKLKLLIALDAASEVAELPSLYHLPGAPAGVRGLANRHGRVIPVVDLQTLLGVEYEDMTSSWLMIYGHGEDAVGIIVGSLPERKRFAQEDLVDIDQISSPLLQYANAVYKEGSNFWFDVDFERLFASVFQVNFTAG